MADSSKIDTVYPRASFMGLPAEIRQNILRLVTQSEEVGESDLEYRWLTENLSELVAIHYSSKRPPRLFKGQKTASGHQLLRVSRNCYQEAAPLIYEKQGFYLFNNFDWSMWWRIEPSFHPPSFDLYHATHPAPYIFAFIRELAFQPTPEISAGFVRAIEANFPSLVTLRAFRHIYLREESGLLMGGLPDVWREFHRFVLLAAVLVTRSHSQLKYAKWSDWRLFASRETEDSVRTITVKLTPDDTLSPNEDGLLDIGKVSKLPLTDADAWRDAVYTRELRVADFCAAVGPKISTFVPESNSSRPRRIRG